LKEIKTRVTVKDIRTLDRTANIAGKMKNAYIRTKEQSEQTQQFGNCSPNGYAEDHATESIQDITRVAGYEFRRQRKQFAEKTRYRTVYKDVILLVTPTVFLRQA